MIGFATFATIHKVQRTSSVYDIFYPIIFSLIIPFTIFWFTKVENTWTGRRFIGVNTGLNIAFLALFVCAELLFLALILEPHLFMAINVDGSFNESSFNLFSPPAELVFLTAMLSLLFGTIRICTETGVVQGSICGAVAVMFGISLLLFQITPLSITISAINILIGLVMFLVVRSR